jgi:hypothetical protein
MDLKTVPEKAGYYFNIDTSDYPRIFQCIQSPWKLKIASVQHTSVSLMSLVADFSIEEILSASKWATFLRLTSNRIMHIVYSYSDFNHASFLGWGETVHFVRQPLTGLLYEPRMIDDECGAVDGMRIGRGNRNIRIKPTPSSTLSTTNPIWPDLS